MDSICLKAMLGSVVLAGALFLGGCHSSDDVTVSSIRADMAPELQTTAMTAEQHKTRIARTIDHNLRQIWDDADYIFLIDQPSHLSEYPIP